MKFRPCIDLHAGIVKQIVGSTLSDETTASKDSVGPVENFVATSSAGSFARRYKEDGLQGGHIIMLGLNCEAAAVEALNEYPGGMQIGGGTILSYSFGRPFLTIFQTLKLQASTWTTP